MDTFNDYAYYYNAFYVDKNYKKEAEQIDYLLKKYSTKNIKKISDLGCGTGRHDIELQKLGYDCLGVDKSEIMIAAAKENARSHDEEIEFLVEDIRMFRTKRRHDAVISLFHVMSYQNTNDDIRKAFQTARSILEADGIFLFDVWYGPGVLSDKPSLRVKEVEDNKNRLVRIARPVLHDKTNIVDVNYEIFVINKHTNIVDVIHETHSMRYFFTPEILAFLNETGFELMECLDCATLRNTDFNSWCAYYIAKAI